MTSDAPFPGTAGPTRSVPLVEAIPPRPRAGDPRAGEPPAGEPRRGQATAAIPAETVGIFVFEAFVDGLGFLDRAERDRMKLAGGEIFDNLVRHALPLEAGIVTVRASRRPHGAILSFYFRSPRFAAWAIAGKAAAGKAAAGKAARPGRRTARHEPPEPRLDREIGRWRGLGGRMCMNLACSIAYRTGGRVDRIHIGFQGGPPCASS